MGVFLPGSARSSKNRGRSIQIRAVQNVCLGRHPESIETSFRNTGFAVSYLIFEGDFIENAILDGGNLAKY